MAQKSQNLVNVVCEQPLGLGPLPMVKGDSYVHVWLHVPCCTRSAKFRVHLSELCAKRPPHSRKQQRQAQKLDDGKKRRQLGGAATSNELPNPYEDLQFSSTLHKKRLNLVCIECLLRRALQRGQLSMHRLLVAPRPTKRAAQYEVQALVKTK